MKYTPIIGLEIHVELNTKTKMFCRCSADIFGKESNSNTCPVCLGLPGALPYTNKKAVESCIKIALALKCKINFNSWFERKNYFYPDLPKGFQTSQYLNPFGYDGYLDIQIPKKDNSGQTRMTTKRIRITRVHMEEDTAKNTHTTVNSEKISLLDFNRSGIPLVEIVTEPDIHSGEEAKLFLTELQKIIRYLGVSDADMEKGNMRLEPNISLSPFRDLLLNPESPEISKPILQTQDDNVKLPPYKVEVKNINSFKYVEKAINFEIERHKPILEKGEFPKQETRGWNENKNETVPQRSKEDAHDYRYFPEPDIPPIHFEQNKINALNKKIPELPISKTERYIKEFNLSYYDAEIITREKEIAEYFEKAVNLNKELGIRNHEKVIANWIINKKIDYKTKTPNEFIQLLQNSAQTTQVDENELIQVVEKIISENLKAVEDYKSGKIQVIGFLIGQTKKLMPTAETSQIKTALEKALQG